MRNMVVVALLCAACGTTGGGGGDTGPANPCNQASVYTCTEPDTCDEVYDEASADELALLCDDPGESRIAGQCDHTACCYSSEGLFGRESMHCVGGDLAVGYRSICEGRGDIYCER